MERGKNIRGKENLLVKVYKDWDQSIIDAADMFMVEDVLGALMRMERTDATVVFIQNYYGTQEEKQKYIKDLLSLCENQENILILSWAYVSTNEFKEDEYYDQHDFDEDYIKESIEAGKKPIPFEDIIERESKMLESIGFVDINDFVGYEFSKAYVYGNSLGNNLVEFINQNK